MRRRPLLIAAGLIVLALLAAAGWYLGSPLLLDRTVHEEIPFDLPSESEMEDMPASELEAVGTETMATAQAMPDRPMDEEMPAEEEATILSHGQFTGADNFHQGSGRAIVLQLPDGSGLLRLEDFMVTNGPDLHVLLASGDAPDSREDLGEYEDLGELKGNIGNQNYDLPAGLPLDAYQSVVIYCLPFHVIFASAELTSSS